MKASLLREEALFLCQDTYRHTQLITPGADNVQ